MSLTTTTTTILLAKERGIFLFPIYSVGPTFLYPESATVPICHHHSCHGVYVTVTVSDAILSVSLGL